MATNAPSRCPHCGSDELSYVPVPGFLPYECDDCGHLFDVDNANLDAYDDPDAGEGAGGAAGADAT